MSLLPIPLSLAGVAVVAMVCVVLWIRQRYVLVTVHGSSMEPTFHMGQQVIVRRIRPDRLRPATVVVMREPLDLRGHIPPAVRARPAKRSIFSPHTGPCVIKRVVAVPGDPLPRGQIPALQDAQESLVPVGKVILVGDNAQNSYDSREHGYYSVDKLVGVVVMPLNSVGARR